MSDFMAHSQKQPVPIDKCLEWIGLLDPFTPGGKP